MVFAFIQLFTIKFPIFSQPNQESLDTCVEIKVVFVLLIVIAEEFALKAFERVEKKEQSAFCLRHRLAAFWSIFGKSLLEK